MGVTVLDPGMVGYEIEIFLAFIVYAFVYNWIERTVNAIKRAIQDKKDFT